MLLILLCLLVTSSLQAEGYFEKGQQFAEELRQKMSELKSSHPKSSRPQLSLQPGKKCSALPIITPDPEPSFYICMSFSLPDVVWISLSKEMEKSGGMMVLRGLPNNSFKELAKRLHSLRLQGMLATVQINPELFTKFSVSKVPCFVQTDEGSYNKLSGNVSLAFALEKLRAKS